MAQYRVLASEGAAVVDIIHKICIYTGKEQNILEKKGSNKFTLRDVRTGPSTIQSHYLQNITHI